MNHGIGKEMTTETMQEDAEEQDASGDERRARCESATGERLLPSPASCLVSAASHLKSRYLQRRQVIF